MALWPSPSSLRRLFGSRPTSDAGELRRLRDRQESLTRAMDEWVSLLREMERNGEAGAAQYDRYFQAYLQAKQQKKRADLELFNRRQGLA
jgi:hypothetical protein